MFLCTNIWCRNSFRSKRNLFYNFQNGVRVSPFNVLNAENKGRLLRRIGGKEQGKGKKMNVSSHLAETEVLGNWAAEFYLIPFVRCA